MTIFFHYLAKPAQFLGGIMAACQVFGGLNGRFIGRHASFLEAGVDWNRKYW